MLIFAQQNFVLKCKNCSQLIPYFPNPQTIDLNNDKFYSCPRVASLSRIGVCGRSTEWVDFSDHTRSTKAYREQVEKLLQSEEPYEACYRCNGSLGAKPIPAAEQLKREQE